MTSAAQIGTNATVERPKRERARATARRHRAPNGPGLFVTDAELANILGIPADNVRMTLIELDRNPKYQFPPKQRLWGDRRYLPAIETWLDANCGLKLPPKQRGMAHE